MRKQFARAMQENNAIRSQVRSFQYKLDDLLMTSGLEDERFHSMLLYFLNFQNLIKFGRRW